MNIAMLLGAAPTTLPISAVRFWGYPALVVLLGGVGLYFLNKYRKVFAKFMLGKNRKRFVGAAATVFAIGAGTTNGFIDYTSILDDGPKSYYDKVFSLQFALWILYLACQLLLVVRDEALDEELRARDDLTKQLQAHDRRRAEISEIVNAKAQKLRNAMRNVREGGFNRDDVMAILQPKQQIALNLAFLHKAIRRLIGPAGTLRLALFFPSPDGTCLRVSLSYDGINEQCITTPNDGHQECFRLDTNRNCFAVYAARETGLHVIGDTHSLKNEEKNRFEFFDGRQRRQIKSIVAYGYSTDDRGPRAVITADVDRKRAFKTDSAFFKLLKTEFEEFGSRLLYEADVYTMLLGQNEG